MNKKDIVSQYLKYEEALSSATNNNLPNIYEKMENFFCKHTDGKFFGIIRTCSINAVVNEINSRKLRYKDLSKNWNREHMIRFFKFCDRYFEVADPENHYSNVDLEESGRRFHRLLDHIDSTEDTAQKLFYWHCFTEQQKSHETGILLHSERKRMHNLLKCKNEEEVEEVLHLVFSALSRVKKQKNERR